MAGAPYTYSDEQRAAVIRRLNDDGISAAKAVAEAAAGDLYGLPPFDPSPATAERWASKAARDAPLTDAVELPDRAALENATGRLWQLHLQSLDELEALQAKDDRTEKEQRALDQQQLAAIKRQRELNHLPTRTAPDQPRTPEDEPDLEGGPASILDRLASDVSGQKPKQGPDGDAASPVLAQTATDESAGARVRLSEGRRDGRAVPADSRG